MSEVNVIKGKFPHVAWLDLEGEGILTEVAIIKKSETGVAFIRLDQLDMIDKQRLFKIISNRNAPMYEMWDLMSNLTLGNGANALDYFHQYVKILTPGGKVMTPQMGRIGAVVRRAPVAAPEAAPVAEEAPAPTKAKANTKAKDQPAT